MTSADKTSVGSAPTTADMVARCSDLVPTLRERSERAEQLRLIPQETVDEYVRLDFLRVCQPERFGGLGLGVHTAAEMAMEIGRGCCSTAWMTSQWAAHNFWVGFFRLEAQEEYWANSRDVLSSTASALISCEMEPVKGGFRLSGMWRFSSGIDYAEWVMPITTLGEVMIPRSDFTIVDDWYVPGLLGTGSKAFTVDDVFIPEHRFLEMERFAAGPTYGTELYEDPYYHVPPLVVLNSMLQSPLIGMARGILELWEERVLARVDTMSRQPARNRASNQLRFAESAAEVETAQLILRRNLAEMVEIGSSGDGITRGDATRITRNGRYATKLAVRAVDRLVESGDATSAYSPNLLPRWVRDIHMAALSPGNAAGLDSALIEFSRARWNLPTELQAMWASNAVDTTSTG